MLTVYCWIFLWRKENIFFSFHCQWQLKCTRIEYFIYAYNYYYFSGILFQKWKENNIFWLNQGFVKREIFCFRYLDSYFRNGEITSTASQLTSPASQKSQDLNKVPLLLQNLGLNRWIWLLLHLDPIWFRFHLYIIHGQNGKLEL